MTATLRSKDAPRSSQRVRERLERWRWERDNEQVQAEIDRRLREYFGEGYDESPLMQKEADGGR
jgi:hypothetical protein